MTARNAHHLLTPLQRAILDFVSENGPSTSEQVREALLPRHRLKDSSVRTLLRRLEARGYISRRVADGVFVYRANVSSTRVAAKAVKRLIDSFWSGSAEAFLAGMVDEHVLSPEEIHRLAKKVKRAK